MRGGGRVLSLARSRRYDRDVTESTPEPKPLPRLTKDVREALLDANEGFTDSTHYSGKNYSESRQYEITGGQLRVKSNSKTSWADSRRSSEFIADEAETHRFLRERLPRLSLEGVEEDAAARKAVRLAEEKAARDAARKAAAAKPAVEQAEDAVEATVAAGRSGRSLPVPGWVLAVTGGVVAGVYLAPKAKRRWERWRADRAERSQAAGPDDATSN